jgi:hypothetical protein
MKFVVSLLSIAALGGTAEAGRLEKVWEYKPGDGLGVFGLRFSPDGKRIALILGRSQTDESVVIVDAANPQTRTSLAVNPKYRPYDLGSSIAFSWTATGHQLIFPGMIANLEGTTCALPEAPASPGPQLIGRGVAVRLFQPSRLAFLDFGCREVQTWEFSVQSELLATSPERGLVFTRRHTLGGQAAGAKILEADSQKVVREFSWSGEAVFAENGKRLCTIGGYDWHQTVDCIDVDSGQQVGMTKGWTHVALRAASQSSRIVITNYGRKIDFVDWRWALGSLQKRVVWDFESGRELVSWRPKVQNLPPKGYFLDPYVFDISPDGQYIVEGGDGAITLYKIEP